MSLDIYLTTQEPIKTNSTGIFVRENGQTKEISAEEWNLRNPDRRITASEFELGQETYDVYSANITHNLGKMACAANLYDYLWDVEEKGIKTAEQLIEPLTHGLSLLNSNPEKFKYYNPSNGWGNYEVLVNFVTDLIEACKQYPQASVSVWK